MIIDAVLKKEKMRNEEMVMQYSKELKTLPQGTLFIKKNGEKSYCYLRFRKDNKVISRYVGTGDMSEKFKEDIKRRKHIEAMLKVLKKEHTRIEKMEKIKK